MGKYSVLNKFYKSKQWRDFRAGIIAKRGPVCEECGKIIAPDDCELDHCNTELTPENVTNVMISLNPDNIKILCHNCHDKRHNRFGNKPKHGVYIVYGPPLAGKTTYVKNNMSRGDLIVDMDKLYAAVSMLPEYDKPDNLLFNVMGIYNRLVDNVKTRYGKWYSAWIIGGLADKYKRERLAQDIGAELIFCDTSKQECIARLELDEDRKYRKAEWKTYINKWFDRYVP